LDFPKQASRVQIFGPRQDLLPDPFGRIVFANETAAFQDLVLQERTCLSEHDQIDIPANPVGQICFEPEPFTAGDFTFRNDRQIEITVPTFPARCCGPE
jgi:hypothetical protein